MRKGWIGAAVLVFVISGCSGKKTVEEIKEDNTKWQYVVDRDEMRNTASVAAALFSKDFTGIYGQKSNALLTVDQTDGMDAVVINVSGNTVSCLHGCKLLVKTDTQGLREEEIEQSKTDLALLFLKNPKSLIADLSKAKSIMMEINFYNSGSKVIKFETDAPLLQPLPSVGS